MNENMATSVEAALAQPQNQPSAPTSTPTTPPTPTSPQPTNDSGKTTAGVPNSDLLDSARRTVNQLIRGVRSGTLGGMREGVRQNQTISEMLQGVVSPQATTPQPASPQPTAQQPVLQQPVFSLGRSAIGTAQVNGYDYGGVRVELPEGFDMNDSKALEAQTSFSNQIVDWMNEDEEEA